MNSLLRNILAVMAGCFLGGMVNFALIMIGGQVVPLPGGVDAADPEALKAAMAQMSARHFVFPFLAHALGTLTGAWLASRLAASRGLAMGLIVGGFFLLGGITNVVMLGGPLAFAVLDLGVAYLPMGWLGGWLGTRTVAAGSSG